MNQKIKQNKAITLIALVVTIIVLVILAGVTLNIVMNENGIIEKSKETKSIQDIATAKEQLELLKAPIKLNGKSINLATYLEKLEEDKDKYKASDIEKVNEKNATVLIDNKYKFLITDEENGNVKIEYQGEAAGLILSEISGTLTYPETKTFKVIENESGGNLTVESENENIATVEINETTVTVQSQKVSGTVKIIVRSEANNGFAAGKTIYTATVENGTITLDATPYTGIYDGNEHDAITSITVNPTDAKIEYSLNGGEYSEQMPRVMGSSEYSVSIKASKEGYITKTITKTITINQQGNTSGNLTLSETSGTLTYPTTKTFTVSKNVSGGQLSVKSSNEAVAKVSINGTTITLTPQVLTSDGQKATITVTSAATSNYAAQTATYTATVNRGTLVVSATGYNGKHDGNPHGITVTCQTSGVTITYSKTENGTYSTTNPTYVDTGTYTTYYKVEKAGYVTVKNYKTVNITHTHIGDTINGGACYQTPVYHVHTGNESTNGGCYTTPVYHVHDGYRCYKPCGGELGSPENVQLANGQTWTVKVCKKCGGWTNPSSTDVTCTIRTSTLICNKTIDSYQLSCGKTNTTIEGYQLSCQK